MCAEYLLLDVMLNECLSINSAVAGRLVGVLPKQFSQASLSAGIAVLFRSNDDWRRSPGELTELGLPY